MQNYEEQKQEKIIFWGQELSEYEIKYHKMSYKTLASQFDFVLCNNIVNVDANIWENVESGYLYDYYNEEGEEITEEEAREKWALGEEVDEVFKEIYQYFLVDSSALWYLKRAEQLVLYSETLDCYVWCVEHWGTSWDYVLTSIEYNDDFSCISYDKTSKVY